VSKKISFQEAQKKFEEQGRTDIRLCKDGYNGWSNKSKFFDLILNQEFWSIPQSVFANNSSPLRATENRKQTNLERYGVEFPQQSNQIQEKYKQTNLERYGVENIFQTNNFKEKIKRTNLEKYGVEHILQAESTKEKIKQTNLKRYGVKNPSQSQKIKEKKKQACLEKYGVENPSQSEEIKEKKRQTVIKNFGFEHQMHSAEVKDKIKQTNFERYGVENPFQLEKFQKKSKQTCLEKYGVEYSLQSQEVRKKIKQTNLRKYGVEYPIQSKKIQEKIKQTNLGKYGVEYYTQTDFFKKNIKEQLSYRLVKETGERLKDWLFLQKDPKPSYSSIIQKFPENQISLIDLKNFLKNYKDHKSNLEVFTENLFNIKHFNKQPKNFNIQFRPDFQLNDQIFLNVDGLYWHSEKQREKKYHFNLREEFEENGLQIFQFYENELLEKTDIVKSIIDNATKKISNKIFARKCEIKSTSHKEAKIFLNQNHLMESTTAKHIGLYHQDELVSIISYKHKKQKTICNIERFCSKINMNIVGGFSKLLKYLENNCLEPNCQEIHNWVDLRYGSGIHLLDKGFEIQKETLGWRWTNCKTTYNRLKCRANMDERRLTQQQYADELNWYKIYDAGQRLYTKKFKSYPSI